MNNVSNVVIEVEWIECERGFGRRTDCYSYHWSLEEAKRYLDTYCKSLPPTAPEVFYAPSDPRFVRVNPVFAFLVEGKGIVWTENSCRQE